MSLSREAGDLNARWTLMGDNRRITMAKGKKK